MTVGDAKLTEVVHDKLVAAATPVAMDYLFNKKDTNHAGQIKDLEKTIEKMSPDRRDELTGILNSNPDAVIQQLANAFSDGKKLDGFVDKPDTILDAAKEFNKAAQNSNIPAQKPDPLAAISKALALSPEQNEQFKHFVELAKKNPKLAGAMEKLTGDNSPASTTKAQAFVEGLQKQLKDNPDLFEKLNHAFEHHPQAVAQKLEELMDDPTKTGGLKRVMMVDGIETWLTDHHMGFLNQILDWLFIDGGLTNLFHSVKETLGGAAKPALAALGIHPAIAAAVGLDDGEVQGPSSHKFAVGKQLLTAEEAHENDGTQLTFQNADKIKPETRAELEKDVGPDGQILEDADTNTLRITSPKKSIPALKPAA